MQSIPQEETQQPEDADLQASSDIRTPASTPSGGEEVRRIKAASLVISGPASGHHLQAFTLPDSTGHPVRLWQYLQRSNVVIFFHHGINCAACEAFLQELVAQLDAYRQEETAVVALGPDEPAENRQQATRLGHPFPFLSDPAGRVIAHQGLATPSLVIADRWGEIWAAWLGGTTHQFPSQQDILQWLSFIEAQCPECTMIEWTNQEDDHLPA